jgi:hypothetical protein
MYHYVREAAKMRTVNWFGLVGGVLALVLVLVSLFYSWWHLSAGDDLVVADMSPFIMKFVLFGTELNFPLIGLLNFIGALSFGLAGSVMLIYSFLPTKCYSMDLLGFAYKKPFYSVLFFVAVLFGLAFVVGSFAGLHIPVVGSANTLLPDSTSSGVMIRVFVSAGFQWPFWLAVTTAIFCFGARIYHKRIVKQLRAC